MPAPISHNPAITTSDVTVFHGDAIRVLRTMPDATLDAVVCDPPYAIAPIGDVRQPYRIDSIKALDGPRGRCATCGGPPAAGYSLCGACLENIEIDSYANSGMLGQQSQNWHVSATHSRGYADNNNTQFGYWCLLWLRECLRVLKPGGHLIAFGGTRTWHRLAVAAEDAGFDVRDSLAWLYATGFPKSLDVSNAVVNYLERHTSLDPPAQAGSAEADWDGWGTALKPAHEPILLARKPLTGTVAANVLTFGVGGLNIDGTRLSEGRWPSNVFLDSAQSQALDDVTTDRPSRFFWAAKPDQAERVQVDGVTHPTVKPLDLMRELVRLVTPPGGTVLDPFAGSGTTVEACILEGRQCVAVEKDAAYLPLIRQRIDRRLDPVAAVRSAESEDMGLFSLFEEP